MKGLEQLKEFIFGQRQEAIEISVKVIETGDVTGAYLFRDDIVIDIDGGLIGWASMHSTSIHAMKAKRVSEDIDEMTVLVEDEGGNLQEWTFSYPYGDRVEDTLKAWKKSRPENFPVMIGERLAEFAGASK